jgi:hypothetical protein
MFRRFRHDLNFPLCLPLRQRCRRRQRCLPLQFIVCSLAACVLSVSRPCFPSLSRHIPSTVVLLSSNLSVIKLYYCCPELCFIYLYSYVSVSSYFIPWAVSPTLSGIDALYFLHLEAVVQVLRLTLWLVCLILIFVSYSSLCT